MNNQMRLLSRVLLILVLSLIVMALPTAPAQADCGTFIELSPEYGLPGTNVTVYGHGLGASVLVDIYYDGSPLVTDVRTDGGGDFAYTFNIPEGCQGHHQVLASSTGKPSVLTLTVRMAEA